MCHVSQSQCVTVVLYVTFVSYMCHCVLHLCLCATTHDGYSLIFVMCHSVAVCYDCVITWMLSFSITDVCFVSDICIYILIKLNVSCVKHLCVTSLLVKLFGMLYLAAIRLTEVLKNILTESNTIS